MNKNQTIYILVTVIVLALITGAILTQSNPAPPSPQPTFTQTSQTSILAAGSSPSPVYTPTPYAGNIIRLAWFYKPPTDDQLGVIVNDFDLFILTHKDENERDQLRTRGVKSPISQYLLFLVIEDPGDCEEEPSGNQVAYKAGDFCMISEQHPDWFLLDSSGNRIKSGKDTYHMDPGNAGYREFWLERAREMQESFGWDSIFLDNVEASTSKMTQGSTTLALYPDDLSYQAAVKGFLDYIRSNYFQPRNKPVYGNIVSMREEDNAVWDRYIQSLDGVLMESFATDWSDGYPKVDDWEREMSHADSALAQGKTLILVAQGKQDDAKLQAFSFASYLLLADGNVFFRYTSSDKYREVWLYENYSIDLGTPLGDRYPSGKDGWRRDFTHGYVIVNPKNHKVEIVTTP
jgi:hypothetical protein